MLFEIDGASRRRSLFHPDHQDADVGRGDAGDARGLAQGGGLDFGQLLAGFGAEAGHFGVIQPGRDLFVFQSLELGNFDFLAGDVAFVFDGNLDLLDDFR